MNLKQIIKMPALALNKVFNIKNIEAKVNNPSSPMGLPLLPTGDKPVLYAQEAILYFMECAPVQTAIYKITEEIAAIEPLIWDKKKEIYVKDHPLLELLAYPDADFVWSEFILQLASYFLITGNAYIKADGFIEQPPLNLRVMPSQGISIVVGFDGYAQNITARILSLMDNYNRTEVKDNGQIRFRYYANEFKELYQIRTFNPMLSSAMGYGLSPLNAIFYEMRQYIEVAKYNLSSLERGVRLSGFIKSKNMLPDTKKQEYLQQMNYGFAGSTNAGRFAFFDQDLDFVDTLKGSRDMDYTQMRDRVTESIYNALKIPLPLINPEKTSYNNMETAKLMLYDNAVLPLTRRLYSELTNFLMPRYKNSENLILSFNEKDISALEPRRNEQSKIKRDLNIFTKNEIRSDYGVEPLSGGNQVYEPMGNVAVAFDIDDPMGIALSDGNTYDQEQDSESGVKPLEKPKESYASSEGSSFDKEEDKETQKATKEKFINTLRMQVNKDGLPRFDDEEIDFLANKHYGKN